MSAPDLSGLCAALAGDKYLSTGLLTLSSVISDEFFLVIESLVESCDMVLCHDVLNAYIR